MNIESNWQVWKQVSLWKLRELVFECCYVVMHLWPSLSLFMVYLCLQVRSATHDHICHFVRELKVYNKKQLQSDVQQVVKPAFYSHLGYIALLFVSRCDFWGSMDLAYHCCTSWPVSLCVCSSSLLKKYQSNHVFWFDWLHRIRVDMNSWEHWICWIFVHALWPCFPTLFSA